MNAEPIEHTSQSNLITFRCARADLSVPIAVTGWGQIIVKGDTRGVPMERFASDVAEFAAWHAINIFPQLNGFQGYNCITFKLERPAP